jgi:hypothetical protein
VDLADDELCLPAVEGKTTCFTKQKADRLGTSDQTVADCGAGPRQGPWDAWQGPLIDRVLWWGPGLGSRAATL